MKGIFKPGHCPETESCYHSLRYILDCRFHLHAINEVCCLALLLGSVDMP